MTRFIFGLAILAVWTNVGFAQTKEIQEQLDKQLKDLRTEDELLRQALASHPDVLVAQAKRQVAEAELAQVKMAVAQKQSKLKSELVIEENALRAARITLDRLMEMRKKGVVSDPEVLDAETKVQFAQAKLSHISTELQELMPDPKNSNSQHPDVRVAMAKLHVAEAELAQTKLVLSQKIATLKADIKGHKQTLSALEEHFKTFQNLQEQGVAAKTEFVPYQLRVLESRTTLSRLQSELKNMTDLTLSRAVQEFTSPSQLARPITTFEAPYRLEALRYEIVKTTPGSPAEKIKHAIGLPVRYAAKSKQAEIVLKDLQKAAGLDVMFRITNLTPGKLWKEEITAVTVDAELTFSAWIELVLDEINTKIPSPQSNNDNYEAYVRDYGLLVAQRSAAPADAITLREFARQVRAENEKEKAATETKKP